jgi:UDP-glucose 4-epimerase
MRVLVTGAFGNIGQNVVTLLLKSGYRVRCLDVATEKNKKSLRTLSKNPQNRQKVEVVWGDIRSPEGLDDAARDVSAIIHLAAVIPPLSERRTKMARDINVGGTHNILEAARGIDPKPRFVFTSSVSVYGPRMTDAPPRKACESLNPTDHYTHHKVECEAMIRRSGLPWTILRVGVASVSDVMGRFDPIVFKIPLDQRFEFVHSRDAARACVNAITADVVGKILLIGGGKGCQILHRDFLRGVMGAAGIGMLPESAFLVPREPCEWYYTDYLDTEEAQRLLQYQSCTFEEYLEEVKNMLGPRRYVAQALRPAIKFFLVLQSPYFKDRWQKKLKRR